MIRILHVLGSLNMGGAETLVMNLYKNIDRSKIQFDFVVHGDEKGYYEEEITKLGGKIYRVPLYKGYNHFSYKKVWKSFLKEHNEYRIIHGHMRSTASIYLNIAKKMGLFTISHSHNTSNGKGFSSMIKKILQYKIKYVADYFMGCTYEANKWLFGKRVANSNKCIVLNNGIDTTKFNYSDEKRKKSRKELGLNNEFVIGNVGRLCYQKNQEYLLDVFYEVKKIKNNSKLLLIGSGELKNELEEKAKSLDIFEDIIFLSNRNDIDCLMNAMDCFVFPSRFEGLGIVVIEAQSTGLKCVISDTIPSNVIVTNLVKTMSINVDACDWAKEIVKDFDKREDKVKEIIDAEFDIKKSAEKLCELYFSILKIY